MAFPQVVCNATSSRNTVLTDDTVTLPRGIVSGDQPGYAYYPKVASWMPNVAADIEAEVGPISGLDVLEAGCAYSILADLLAALATVESDNVEALRNLLSNNAEIGARTLAANSVDPWGATSGADRDAAASAFDANALIDATGDRDPGRRLGREGL